MENPRPEKVAVVDEVRERFGASSAALLTEYRGLDVSALGELRRALREGLGLVLPADCAGCGAWDTAVCADCRDLLSTVPVRSDMDAPVLGLPGDADTAAGLEAE